MKTPVRHHAAGLIVAADRPLPGFVAAPRNHPPDVRIHLDCRPDWHAASSIPLYAADRLHETGLPIVTVLRSLQGFHFHYADRTRIWVAARGTDVWSTAPDTASLDDTCTYLSGPILGLVLRLRGALAFHASAVQIGGGAVGFVGSHGAGKSTLAAALGAAACPVVTDDVLHVRVEDRRWLAEPFTSMLKLWPDGARLALGEDADLPRIADGWDKRALHLGGAMPAAAAALPLIALACLGPRGAGAAIQPITPATALARLAGNSSAAHLLDTAARVAEFRALSTLVRGVPCVAITPPEAPSAYPSFVAGVLEWARALAGTRV